MNTYDEGTHKHKTLRTVLAIGVIALGLACMVIGIVFISVGASTQSMLKKEMQREQITLGVPDPDIAQGEVIDTADKAKRAGDIVRSHRHDIAPTYGDLLGGERYDPTDLEQLTYAQALNLENYLYLAVASFGLATMAIGAGVALLLVGLGLAVMTFIVAFWPRRKTVSEEPGCATTPEV